MILILFLEGRGINNRQSRKLETKKWSRSGSKNV